LKTAEKIEPNGNHDRAQQPSQDKLAFVKNIWRSGPVGTTGAESTLPEPVEEFQKFCVPALGKDFSDCMKRSASAVINSASSKVKQIFDHIQLLRRDISRVSADVDNLGSYADELLTLNVSSPIFSLFRGSQFQRFTLHGELLIRDPLEHVYAFR
jgi:hypothetical protein